MGWDLKSESVFLLCALQCQSTHCNLPKVAAIYAIKHVFNIPEPHCVCVFLAHSLIRSLPLTLSCLSPLLFFFFFLFMCVCVSLRSSSLFPLHRRIISPPQRRDRQEVGVYIGLLYPKKAASALKLQSTSAVSAAVAAVLCHYHCCVPSHPTPPPPPAAVPPMVRSFSQVF